ncbi:thiamine pyrophosphate-dependent dehydrogenase E1 component subunit alpha [bacterium]|nr:thiamine pyrophosphate-dependent dehydrogenase E1 component subunit alpha [bacterium]
MTPDIAKQLLFQMRRIRHVEQEIARRYSEGKMRCPTHLSVGQEAVSAAVGLALRRSDMAVSGHRAHAHYLAKGGSLPAILAEIYGRIDGCSRGKGGSMHLVDESVGFMGSTAIVAGTIPVGVGLAYGMKCKRADQVSCIFHGDAAVEAGVFFESVNFAVVKKLPVLFLCENNLFSVYSPLSVRQPEGRSIAKMAEGLGMKSSTGDGNDVAEVYAKTIEALARIRAGGGPELLEFSTYRWLEHCGPNYDNDLGYRTEAEYLAWKAKEPITRFESVLLTDGIVSAAEVKQMDLDIAREVNDAFELADASPFPGAASAYTDLHHIESSVTGIQPESVGA